MTSSNQMIAVLDDTTAERLRDLTTGQRLRIADRIRKFAHDMLTHHVSSEHPDWTEADIHREVAQRISDPAFEEWAYWNLPSSLFLK